MVNPFGNDDDGWRGWAYWLRNPFHNLCFKLLRRPVTDPVYVFGRRIDDPQGSFILRFRPFFLKIGPVFVGWRADKPHPLAWGGKYGSGGGAFDIGAKRLG